MYAKKLKQASLAAVCALGVAAACPAIANTTSALLEDEQNTISIFNKTSPFVIYVHNIQQVVDFFYNAHEVQAGTGSGFLWDDKGHVVTNFHVIQDSNKLAVSFGEGKTIPATVVGVDPRKDIAVLKLESLKDVPAVKSTPAIPLADSSKLLVGQKAIAIGNPFGLDRTITRGIISAIGRSVPGVGGVKIRDMVQTDASINPGNSGGPLINSSGELIGMNTVIFSQSGSSAGVGFAVPSNTIRRTVEQILRSGRVVQPGLGFERIDDHVAAQLGIKGLIIARVVKNTPAAKAGFRGTTRDRFGQINLGDIIVALDGKKVENYDDFYNILEKKKLGDEVEVTYLRGDEKKRKVTVKLVDVEER